MSTINKNIELVISKYNEDTTWIKDVNSNIKITIYDKSIDPLVGSISLPNVGREINTYFTHIVNNFEDLSDVIFFCQGNPFQHISYFIELINNLDNNNYKPTLIVEECLFYNTCYGNKLITTDNYGKPHDFRGINVSNTWNVLFETTQPNIIEFSPGCQFKITKNQIINRGKDFFIKCLNTTNNNEFSAWEFERVMRYVIDPKFK